MAAGTVDAGAIGWQMTMKRLLPKMVHQGRLVVDVDVDDDNDDGDVVVGKLCVLDVINKHFMHGIGA